MRNCLYACLISLALAAVGQGALTAIYVTADSDGGVGSQIDPMTWAEMVVDINTPHTGYIYYVQEGTYTLTASDTLTGDGSATQPNVIQACLTDWTPTEPVWTSSGLDTTHMPYIVYNGDYYLTATGATYTIIRGLRFTSARSSGTVRLGTSSVIRRCHVRNTIANNSAASGIVLYSAWATADECDVAVTGANSAGAIVCTDTYTRVVGCLVSDSPTYGIAVTGTASVVANNLVYGCDSYGIFKTSTTTTVAWTVLHNTVYGLGIGTADAAYTNLDVVIGNHLTDGSGYAITNPNATGSPVMLAINRTRDNSSGAISWAGDWAGATTWNHVTTDAGDASTDFIDYSGTPPNFALVPTAAGFQTGMWGGNIGALPTPHPTLPAATNVLSSADDYGYAWNLLDPSWVVPDPGLVWNTETYGVAGAISGTMHASDITVTNGDAATLTAPDIVNGVIVDDVTGTATGGGTTVIVVVED